MIGRTVAHYTIVDKLGAGEVGAICGVEPPEGTAEILDSEVGLGRMR